MDNQEDQLNLLRWEPGMELSTEKEHEAATAWLAMELLRVNTPEQVAVIAAEQVIFALPRKARAYDGPRGLSMIADKRRRHEAETDEALVKGAVAKKMGQFAIVVSSDQRKASSKNATDARYLKGRARKAKALAAWEASGRPKKITYADDHYAKYFVSQERMYNWLVKHEITNT
jgi:hypothetical protein